MTVLLVMLAVIAAFITGFIAGRVWLAQAITREMEGLPA